MATEDSGDHSPSPVSGPSPDDDARFGQTLLAEKLVTHDQLQEVLKVQTTLHGQGIKLRLGEVLVKKGVLTPEQVRDVLQLLGKVLLRCPQCGRNFNVKNWLPGRVVSCPACSSPLEVPPADASVDASETQELSVAVPGRDARDSKGKPFGRYRLLDELGRGGMGVVWKAWDTQLKRIVALKQILAQGGLDAEQIQRFMREAQLAAKLRHPNIVSVLDVGTFKGQPYFTTDYIAGKTMEQLRKPIPAAKCVPWVAAIGEALYYAHQQGVVHRDVKPGNLLLDTRGKPYVMDFGLAKEVEVVPGKGRRGPALTLSGALLGTPQYMSPEQAAGQLQKVGPASDQFALGVVLYELLTGRPPFGGANLRDLLNSITDADPTPPTALHRQIHPDLDAICLKALEKDPRRRYASMDQLVADLHCYAHGEPVQARPASRMTKMVRRVAKHRLAVIGGGITVAILALLSVLVFRTYSRVNRSYVQALGDARKARQGNRPQEARDAYQRVLALESSNEEAREGIDWADEAIARTRQESVASEVDRRESERAEALRSKILRTRDLAIQGGGAYEEAIARLMELRPSCAGNRELETLVAEAQVEVRKACVWNEYSKLQEEESREPGAFTTKINRYLDLQMSVEALPPNIVGDLAAALQVRIERLKTRREEAAELAFAPVEARTRGMLKDRRFESARTELSMFLDDEEFQLTEAMARAGQLLAAINADEKEARRQAEAPSVRPEPAPDSPSNQIALFDGVNVPGLQRGAGVVTYEVVQGELRIRHTDTTARELSNQIEVTNLLEFHLHPCEECVFEFDARILKTGFGVFLGLRVQGSDVRITSGGVISNPQLFKPDSWHHFRIGYDKTRVTLSVDNFGSEVLELKDPGRGSCALAVYPGCEVYFKNITLTTK